jgi:hypothetical protein
VAVLAVLTSLGPALIVDGHETRTRLPYLLFYYAVPGFDALRVPGRFMFAAILAACPLAALGIIRLTDRLERLHLTVVPAGRWAIPLAILVLFATELGFEPFPTVASPLTPATVAVGDWLAARRPGPIAEFPMDPDREFTSLLLSTRHWLPMVNGVAVHPSQAPNPGKSGTIRGEMSGTLVSRRFDGWVSAYVDLAAVRAPLHRWRPHPSTPLMRRRAPLALDDRE